MYRSPADCLDRWVRQAPSDKALGSCEGLSLTYAELAALVRQMSDALRCVGTEMSGGPARDTRIAWSLPRGPSGWAAFLATESLATGVPLPPPPLHGRLEVLLDEAGVCILLTTPRFARDMPRSILGKVAVVTLDPTDFSVKVASVGKALRRSPARAAEDDALLVPTSGSTGSPKLVPLTRRNIMWSASRIARFFRLDRDDICLNLMPAFHVHGLLSAGLATLVSGGALLVGDGSRMPSIARALTRSGPTWITGVPALYHSLLLALEQTPPASHRLRFVRVASAALDPPLRRMLESRFGVRVVESYGLTETASLVASQSVGSEAPLEAGVGRPVGAEIAVRDEKGNPLPPGVSGELVVRGPGVTRGYLDGDTPALPGGWLRTGDLGYLDRQKNVHVTGRIKQIIRRGGESISPEVVEERLRLHANVAGAVVFGVPHPILGEVPVALAEMREASARIGCTGDSLRQRLPRSLPVGQLPCAIASISALPLNAVGKVDRLGSRERTISSPVYRMWRHDETAPDNPEDAWLQELIGRIAGTRPGIRRNLVLSGLGTDVFRELADLIGARFRTRVQTIDVLRNSSIASMSSWVRCTFLSDMQWRRPWN